mgnify:CR=1 FL=1
MDEMLQNEELKKYIDEIINNELERILEEKQDKIAKALNKSIKINEYVLESIVSKINSKSGIKTLSNNISENLEKYFKELETIESLKDSIKSEIIASIEQEKQESINTVKNVINSVAESEKKYIKKSARTAFELVEYVENAKKRIVSEVIEEATKKFEIEDTRPRTIEIYSNNSLEKTLTKELYHEKFETIYKLVRLGLPVMLIGPTGSGKSVMASQIATALNLPLYYTNNASEEYKLLGFTDAYGKYKETQFYKAFKNGGLFFLDEIDCSHPTALLSINSAIGATNNGIYMAFEDGNFTQAHPDFKIIAAANTWGSGANRMYCGRNELDAASLDRFIQVYFDYDKKLEKSLINDEELLSFFWDFRKVINDLGIRHTVTTRNIDYAYKLKQAGFSISEILKYTIIKELDFEDMKIILKRFNEEEILETPYLNEFKSLTLKRI